MDFFQERVNGLTKFFGAKLQINDYLFIKTLLKLSDSPNELLRFFIVSLNLFDGIVNRFVWLDHIEFSPEFRICKT